MQDKEEVDSDSDSVIVEDDGEQGDLVTETTGVAGQHLLSDIERLKLEKEQLTRKLQNQQQTKQDIEVWSQPSGLTSLCNYNCCTMWVHTKNACGLFLFAASPGDACQAGNVPAEDYYT